MEDRLNVTTDEIFAALGRSTMECRLLRLRIEEMEQEIATLKNSLEALALSNNYNYIHNKSGVPES